MDGTASTANAATARHDVKLKAIRRMRAAGYTLIPLNGKVPISSDWPRFGPADFSDDDLVKGNYGVSLKPGDVVLDVDPRHFAAGDKPLARLAKDAGIDLTKTFMVRTGGGGFHIYFTKSPDALVRYSLKDYPGIDCRTTGQQVVGPGSIHPETGKLYEIITDVPTAEAPDGLLALIRRTAVPFSELGKGTGDYKNDAATQGRYVDYLKNSAPVTGSYKVACTGRDFGLPPGLTLELMMDYWNPRRAIARTRNELEAKVIHAYKYAKSAVGHKHPAADFEATMSEKPAPAPEKEDEISWVTLDNGQLKKCFFNLLNYLKLPEGGLYKVFGLNEFTGMVEFINPAPWHKGIMPRSTAISDNDLKLLKGHLAVQHGYEAQVKEIEEAVTVIGHKNRFHPVREYLLGLKWDGVKRLDFWLRDFAGVEDSTYTRAVSRKLLCAAVARVMHPGCKFDQVVILEGPQDAGKSMLCEALGWKWGADFAVDPTNKDTIANMQGKWIVELAEMSILNTSKNDREALKAFITRRIDKVRPAYGRLSMEFPRQSIFIGTINPQADKAYLDDPTGNRRFWPIEVADRVDFKGIAEVRNMLYAEAVVRVQEGEKLYMETDALKAEAKQVVGMRQIEHPWTERIVSWLLTPDPMTGKLREFTTSREVFLDALGGVDKALTRRETIPIANILRAQGWAARVVWDGGRALRGFGIRHPETAKDKGASDDLFDGLVG